MENCNGYKLLHKDINESMELTATRACQTDELSNVQTG